MPQTFVTLLREQINRSHLSIRDLATRAELPLATTSMLVTGSRRPQPDQVVRLGKALGLTGIALHRLVLAGLDDPKTRYLRDYIAEMVPKRR